MKKFLTMAAALAFAFNLTACHDDDDDSDYVADFTEVKAASTIPGISTVGNYAGVHSYMLSDASGYTDIYTFTQSSVDTTEFPMTVKEDFAEGWYGGMCPTWFTATDEETYFTPACGEFHSGTGCVIANPGTVCRALFSKHFAVDFQSALSFLMLEDIKGLYVCPTDAYNYLTTEEGRTELEITNPTSACKIQFCVYGYVDSFRFSNFKTFISALTGAAGSIGKGGKMCSNTVDLATFDGSTWTVNKDWQYLDLEPIDDFYMFEAYIRVVDTNDKVITTFEVSDENMLNYACIDDITYERKF